MSVCSVPFLAFCGLLALAVRSLPGRLPRQALLAAANLAFLYSVLPNKKTAACLGAFVGGTYALLWLVRARPSRPAVTATICLVIAVFLYLKRYSFLEWLLPQRAWLAVPEVLGISYMLFKFIHMVVDQSQDQLPRFNFFSYANYQLSFFTILAGPIQRYNDFHDYWAADVVPPESSRLTLGHWNRFLNGMIKLGLLAPVAWDVFAGARTALLDHPDVDVPRRFLALFYSYPVYMYLNFSGYTDIVVAGARLVGWTLPENFNRPYLSRNVIDYWNRWHISLTHWIRDYVFMTFYKMGAELMPGLGKPLGYGLLFVSLLLSGVWHGSTAGFAVFGAIHGLGAAATQIYTDVLRSRLGRERFRAYQKSRAVHAIATVVTLHFVGFAFLFFASSLAQATAILQIVGRALLSPATWARPSPPAWPLDYWPLVLVPALAALAWKRTAILDRLGRIGIGRGAEADGPPYALVLAKSAVITFLLISLWALEKEPEIAYMRF